MFANDSDPVFISWLFSQVQKVITCFLLFPQLIPLFPLSHFCSDLLYFCSSSLLLFLCALPAASCLPFLSYFSGFVSQQLGVIAI